MFFFLFSLFLSSSVRVRGLVSHEFAFEIAEDYRTAGRGNLKEARRAYNVTYALPYVLRDEWRNKIRVWFDLEQDLIYSKSSPFLSSLFLSISLSLSRYVIFVRMLNKLNHSYWKPWCYWCLVYSSTCGSHTLIESIASVGYTISKFYQAVSPEITTSRNGNQFIRSMVWWIYLYTYIFADRKMNVLFEYLLFISSLFNFLIVRDICTYIYYTYRCLLIVCAWYVWYTHDLMMAQLINVLIARNSLCIIQRNFPRYCRYTGTYVI